MVHWHGLWAVEFQVPTLRTLGNVIIMISLKYFLFFTVTDLHISVIKVSKNHLKPQLDQDIDKQGEEKAKNQYTTRLMGLNLKQN